MQNGLKPCPFCGKGNITITTTLSTSSIFCYECGVKIERSIMGKYSCLADAKAELETKVVTAWNRRANEEQDRELEELHDAISDVYLAIGRRANDGAE